MVAYANSIHRNRLNVNNFPHYLPSYPLENDSAYFNHLMFPTWLVGNFWMQVAQYFSKVTKSQLILVFILIWRNFHSYY